MGYEVVNGEVVSTGGSNGDGKPHRIKPFELSELFAKQIPKGYAIDDVMHALNMLMSEAVARRGDTLEQRKRIAEAFHTGLMRSLELNSVVEGRVNKVKDQLKADGREIGQEEFKKLVAAEMKQAAEELRQSTVERPGVVHDVGVSESAAPHDIAGHATPKDGLQ